MRKVNVYTTTAKTKIAYSGLFHCWGCEYEEFENGAGNYTVAIIEKDNGEVMRVEPEYIMFEPVDTSVSEMDGEEFLQSKDIWNHPRITDRNGKESYCVAELLDEYLSIMGDKKCIQK